MTATPVFPQTIKNGQVQILPADTTSLKTIYTAAANGSVVSSILMSSTDTTSRDVQFYVTIGGTDYLLATVSCLLNSGFTNAVPLISVLDHANFATQLVDSHGNRCLYLASGSVLKAKVLVAVTAAKAISLFAQAGDF